MLDIKFTIIAYLKIHFILTTKGIYLIMSPSHLANYPAKECFRGMNPKMTPHSNTKISIRGKLEDGA